MLENGSRQCNRQRSSKLFQRDHVSEVSKGSLEESWVWSDGRQVDHTWLRKAPNFPTVSEVPQKKFQLQGCCSSCGHDTPGTNVFAKSRVARLTAVFCQLERERGRGGGLVVSMMCENEVSIKTRPKSVRGRRGQTAAAEADSG